MKEDDKNKILSGDSMKIYQIHEYYGEWEDFHDIIIGSYLKKERAEEEKFKAEAKSKELMAYSKKCNNCPYLGFDNSYSAIKDLLDKYPSYCEKASLEHTEYGINCDNYYGCYDESTFEIKEVEVIE